MSKTPEELQAIREALDTLPPLRLDRVLIEPYTPETTSVHRAELEYDVEAGPARELLRAVLQDLTRAEEQIKLLTAVVEARNR